MKKNIPKAFALFIGILDFCLILMWDSKYLIYSGVGRGLKPQEIVILSLALIFFSDFFSLLSQKDNTPAIIFKIMGWICLLGMTPWVIIRFIDSQ